MVDELEARSRARYEAENDPVQREAYALAKRAGFDWYNTESSARRMAEHAADEVVALVQAIGALIEGLEPSSPDQFPGHSAAYLRIVAIPRAREALAKVQPTTALGKRP